MNNRSLARASALSLIFVQEQLKEPISLFWIIIFPCAVFYLFALSKGEDVAFSGNYIEATRWFYAYIASSVAFFGFSFYIIGRRESGYIRSFIYHKNSKAIFMLAQILSYSFIALVYCSVFYLTTRLPYGSYELTEFLFTLMNFYFCFLLFSSIGLFFALMPLSFQGASTVFSISNFSMLIMGLISASTTNAFIQTVDFINPLSCAKQLMSDGIENHFLLALMTVALFVSASVMSVIYLRVNPVWSRCR